MCLTFKIRMSLINYGIVLYLLCLVSSAISADGEIMVIDTNEPSTNDNEAVVEDENEEISDIKFIPTSEWQTILPGQAIPKGLHVRINLETGLKEAKLMEENTYSVNTLKETLSKIPNDEGLNLESQRPEKRFRPIEVLQEELAKLNLNMTTETEIMSSIVEKLFEKDVTDEQKLESFSELEYYVHQYDNAQNFVKMGGLQLISPALNSSIENLRIIAADLIGSAMQGNPLVQVAALDHGLLQLILHRLAVDSTKVQIKLLYALSAMIRHFPFAQKKFMDLGGMSVLTKFFREEGEDAVKLQIKSINLMYDLVVENQNVNENAGPNDNANDKEKLRQYSRVKALEAIVKHGWCKIIPQLLIAPQHNFREKVLLTMLVTAKSCRKDYLEATPQLKNLQQKYSQLTSKQQMSEDVTYYEELQQLISLVLNNITETKDEL